MKGTILYVGNFELPDKGASANRVMTNGKLLQKLGYRVAFLGVSKRVEEVRCLDEKRHLYEESYPAGIAQWFRHIYSIKNIEAVMDRYRDVSMVILYNAPFSLLCHLKAAMKKRNVRVVYDCTEWTKDTEGSMLKRLVKVADCFLIRHYLQKIADGILVVSTRMKEAYEGSKPVLLLPPLVDLSEPMWHPEIEKERAEFVFCFAGGLDGNKERLDSIVEAVGHLKEAGAYLRVIGVTQEEFCAFYPRGKELVATAGDRVQFEGRLSHEESVRQILDCDCYIFIREADLRNQAGFPTKFVEAYSSGVRVITTDVSDVRKYQNQRIQLLQSVFLPEMEEAMAIAVQNKKREERELDETFHYEKYEEVCREWITKF